MPIVGKLLILIGKHLLSLLEPESRNTSKNDMPLKEDSKKIEPMLAKAGRCLRNLWTNVA